MDKIEPEKSPFSKIDHIGVIVRDLEKAVLEVSCDENKIADKEVTMELADLEARVRVLEDIEAIKNAES